jgi:hypothetical protein
MCIKDTTTKDERQLRSFEKDKKFNKMVEEISYKDEGVPFLASLKNYTIAKIQNMDNYEVDLV